MAIFNIYEIKKMVIKCRYTLIFRELLNKNWKRSGVKKIGPRLEFECEAMIIPKKWLSKLKLTSQSDLRFLYTIRQKTLMESIILYYYVVDFIRQSITTIYL